MLQTCHDSLYEKLQVEDKPKYTIKGNITDLRGKPCPRYLRPWEGFQAIQQSVYEDIHTALHPPQRGALRMFTSVGGIGQGDMLNGLIRSEEDLKRFHHESVEQYVQYILGLLASNGISFRGSTDLGHGIEFHKNSHALTDGEREVDERRHPDANGKRAATRDVPRPAKADQLCVTRKDDKTRLLFIEDFKAPHKLTQQFLVAALSEPLDVWEARKRHKISNDPDQKFLEDAQILVAAAATQTYAYMLQAGLEYSCIVTGEAIVFLHIEAHDSDTLYFHLAIPKIQVKPQDASTYSMTAVSQLLSFAVLAAQSEQRSQDWRDLAITRADKWELDYDELERALETPRNRRRNSAKHWQYEAPKFNLVRRTYQARPKRDDDDDDRSSYKAADSSGESPNADTPSNSTTSQSNNANHGQGSQISATKQSNQQRNYCTNACLLGVVRRSSIDEGCPNAALHPRSKKQPNLHLIWARQLTTLVTEQLGTTLDKNIINLNVHGARGVLFNITLESHGYTFVGKGTIDVFVADLKHEGVVYNRLRSLQGESIPVYLGNIDLIKRKWYEYGMCILHMLLMSYGGTPIYSTDESMRLQVDHFEAKLDRLGVQHRDLTRPNMLWNEELHRLVCIDFERSRLENKTRTRELQELSPSRLQNQRSPVKSRSTSHLPAWRKG